MDNAQLIHIWANKQDFYKSCGNLSIRSGELFSYNALIGKHFENFIVIQDSSEYSVTTTKHISLAKKACSHLDCFFTTNLRSLVKLSTEEISKKLYNEYLSKIDAGLKKLANARSSIQIKFWEIRKLAESAYKLSRFFKLSEHILTDDQFRFLTNLKPSDCENYDLKSDTLLLDELKSRYDLDLLLKIEKEKSLESTKRDREIRKAEEAIREEKKKVKDWRAGIFNGHLFNLPVMLRLNCETQEIETSHGARVPQTEAIQMFSKFKNNHDLAGYKIGHFICSGITDQHVVIGCHKIPIAEIKNFFNLGE